MPLSVRKSEGLGGERKTRGISTLEELAIIFVILHASISPATLAFFKGNHIETAKLKQVFLFVTNHRHERDTSLSYLQYIPLHVFISLS